MKNEPVHCKAKGFGLGVVCRITGELCWWLRYYNLSRYSATVVRSMLYPAQLAIVWKSPRRASDALSLPSMHNIQTLYSPKLTASGALSEAKAMAC